VLKLSTTTAIAVIHCCGALFIMCCSPSEYKPEEIDGECPDCGNDTVGGDAYECCYYSPCECETCDWRPCDGSC